jgi:hypothetical protein
MNIREELVNKKVTQHASHPPYLGYSAVTFHSACPLSPVLLTLAKTYY